MRRLLVVMVALACGGCVSTAASVVTLPVRAAGYTADKLTTSREEADRNLGRQVRKDRERKRKEAEREAKREKKRQRELEKQARRDGR